jgi:hypothetical protein
MTKIVATPRLEMRATLEIDEGEARFLDALLGYGGEELIKVAMEHPGQAYIGPRNADGLRFCKTAREQLGPLLRQFDDARAVFDGTKKVAP